VAERMWRMGSGTRGVRGASVAVVASAVGCRIDEGRQVAAREGLLGALVSDSPARGRGV
jgi:hypothetical protein